MNTMKANVVSAIVTMVVLGTFGLLQAQPFRARDPGVRGGDPGAGAPLAGLTPRQIAFFEAGRDEFSEGEEVGEGLGPRFNLDSCRGCHRQPEIGGTSRLPNPQADVPEEFPGNVLPSFITADGPVREARFKYRPDGTRDGGVHNLFVITGHPDASGCDIVQDDFEKELARNNVIFRIPTPVFGAGLIEQIPDSAILGNREVNAGAKRSLGIRGRPNRISGDPNNNGNDGTISRFGWKAQNKSLLLFSGEAYNVEMGITNELFQTERDETPSCQFAQVPNDVTDTESQPTTISNAIEGFAFFMRFLAPPTPSLDTPGGSTSIARGRVLFEKAGCALCHTPTLKTGDSTVEVLRHMDVNLFSDLLLHNMGPRLADDIVQGGAGPDEFRTAPLWGLGQRIFFLHDGRTRDLLEAIQAHRSAGNSRFQASEANGVITRFNDLRASEKQDILNFLRSL
ncbi:MAG: di-heme oxidoredictase family protein [Candidatus Methylomirabilales bacterium]